MFFSQPVKLSTKGKWTPYANFPLVNATTKQKIQENINEGFEICKKFGFEASKLKSSASVDQSADIISAEKWYSYLIGAEE